MLNTEKHTPGPWHTELKRGQWLILDLQGGKECEDNALVATVYGTHQNEANAALMARAPALLAQNKRLREALEKSVMGRECEFDPLNPCWNNRATDITGKHWGVGDACSVCNARAALNEKE